MNLKQKTNHFLKELGYPISEFCRRVGITTTTYYNWQKGVLEISEMRQEQIKNEIEKIKTIANKY